MRPYAGTVAALLMGGPDPLGPYRRDPKGLRQASYSFDQGLTFRSGPTSIPSALS